MVNLVQQDPFCSARKIARELNLPVGPGTVRRRLHEVVGARKKPLSDAQKEYRVGYALEHLGRDEDAWRSVIFTDESCVGLVKDGRLRVWRRKGERLSPNFINHVRRSGGFGVPIWGWCSASGAGHLFRINGRLNSEKYVDILENIMKPQVMDVFETESLGFIQDQSPVYTAHIVTQWFQRNRQFVRMDFPVRSPDLNPIENAWAKLKKTVDIQDVLNEDMLWERIELAWEAMVDDMDYWERLCLSMPRRLIKSCY